VTFDLGALLLTEHGWEIEAGGDVLGPEYLEILNTGSFSDPKHYHPNEYRAEAEAVAAVVRGTLEILHTPEPQNGDVFVDPDAVGLGGPGSGNWGHRGRPGGEPFSRR
jgi:hypothetical protein